MEFADSLEERATRNDFSGEERCANPVCYHPYDNHHDEGGQCAFACGCLKFRFPDPEDY